LGVVHRNVHHPFFSDRDIMAMKIQAILGWGKKDRTVAISGWINDHLR